MFLRVCSLVAGIAMLAGCGEEPVPAEDAKAVTRAVERYYDGLGAGDGAAACAELTEEAQRAVAARGRVADCATGVQRTSDALFAEARTILEKVSTERVELQGDRATATLAADWTFASSRGPGRVALTRVDGRWRIASLPEQSAADARP